ncbi:hypothetical protein ACFVAD_23075 [Sutcliffiella sp. NPDC057660]|uniref:hypothetical protein n=1 Tax=Sutcliffiella sp. NPDC057660 TaxID=3346199 RepID=UPI0036ACAEB1
MENVFDYEDIPLVPNKCVVNSRSECDTTVTLGGRQFKLPVVPAIHKPSSMKKLPFTLLKITIFTSCTALSYKSVMHSLKT